MGKLRVIWVNLRAFAFTKKSDFSENRISTANEVLTISEQEINDLVEKFLASIPEIFKMTLRPHDPGT